MAYDARLWSSASGASLHRPCTVANHVTHNYTAACSPYLLLRRIERARLDGSRSAFTRRLSARVELVVGRAAAVHWLVVDVALLIWSTIHCSIESTYSKARHLHQMLRVLGSKSRRGDRGINTEID